MGYKCIYCEEKFKNTNKLELHLKKCNYKKQQDIKKIKNNLLQRKIDRFPWWFSPKYIPKNTKAWIGARNIMDNDFLKEHQLRHKYRRYRKLIFKHMLEHDQDVDYIYKLNYFVEDKHIIKELMIDLRSLGWSAGVNRHLNILFVSDHMIPFKYLSMENGFKLDKLIPDDKD